MCAHIHTHRDLHHNQHILKCYNHAHTHAHTIISILFTKFHNHACAHTMTHVKNPPPAPSTPPPQHTHTNKFCFQNNNAQKPDLMMGKYPLVSVARTCRDSSRTGSGSRAVPPPSSPLPPLPGAGWGRMFLMHSLISQDVSCTWA